MENLCTGVVVDAEGQSTPITLVDIPGEDRVRKKCITKYLTSPNNLIAGIVCVIDSATFAKNARDVAEMVYDLLIDSNRKTPVLIACNKQDSVQVCLFLFLARYLVLDIDAGKERESNHANIGARTYSAEQDATRLIGND